MRALLLSLALCVPASAQVRLVTPSLPLAPVAPRLALPAPALASPLGSLAPTLPRAASVLPQGPAALAAPRAAAAAVAVPNPGPGAAAAPESRAEVDHAARAALELARLADDLGAARGLRMSRMSGADFIAEVEEARGKLASGDAPSGRARAAADDVRASMLRVVRALVKADAPMGPQAPRLLAVWQVFNQELARAAEEKGSLEAVRAEAALFARQVEASV